MNTYTFYCIEPQPTSTNTQYRDIEISLAPVPIANLEHIVLHISVFLIYYYSCTTVPTDTWKQQTRATLDHSLHWYPTMDEYPISEVTIQDKGE